jgi:hypothetical protein
VQPRGNARVFKIEQTEQEVPNHVEEALHVSWRLPPRAEARDAEAA